MANTVDQTCVWKGFGDRFGEWESRCRLRIFNVHPELSIVIISNLRCDNGTIITNCAEQLATNVVKDFNLDPRSLTWIEHLPDSETEYSQVEFDWDRLQASYPCWTFLRPEQVESMIGERL